MIDSFIQTPEEYEEYCTAMNELAAIAEAETPDPEPENQELWEDAMVYERLREESEEYPDEYSEEGYYRDDMGEDSYLDASWEDRFEIDMGDY